MKPKKRSEATYKDLITGYAVKEPMGGSVVGAIQTLGAVDESAPDADLNETSISDNNGGRIKLNEGLGTNNVIKGKAT